MLNSTVGFECARDVVYITCGRAHPDPARRPEFDDVTLLALDLDNGDELWRLALGVAGLSRLAVLDNAVVVSVANADATVIVRVDGA